MNYEKMYDTLVQKRKIEKLNRNTTYCENHHIVPKSWGGSDDENNMVLLTAREHYIAHRLLIRIAKIRYGEGSVQWRQMINAMWYMSHDKRHSYTTSYEYAILKENMALANSLHHSGENHWNYGRHWSEEVRSKISKSHTGKKMSDEFRRKQRELNSGEKNHMYGKTYQCYGLKRYTASLKNKTWEEIYGEEKAQKLKAYHSILMKEREPSTKGWIMADHMDPEKYKTMCESRSKKMRGRRFTEEQLKHQKECSKRYWGSLSKEDRERRKQINQLQAAKINLRRSFIKLLAMMIICKAF